MERGDVLLLRYRQRAVFFQKGLAGRLYWFAILPSTASSSTE